MAESENVKERVEEKEKQENLKQRLEREHNELLQELRALIPGAQVLFGLLLAIRFTGQFGDLDDTQRYVYYFTLLCTASALVFFLAPAAAHRIRFRAGDKEFTVRKGNHDAIAGTAAIALAFTAVIYLVTDLVFGTAEAVFAAIVFFALIVWRWWAMALYRAWAERRSRQAQPGS